MPKKRRNNSPISIPNNGGDIIYYDIRNEISTAIGGVKYVLIIINKGTSHIYEYGSHTLKEQSLFQAMKQIINDIRCKLRLIRADHDFKLIGGQVASYLESPKMCDDTIHTTHIAGAPDGRQNQNGLI